MGYLVKVRNQRAKHLAFGAVFAFVLLLSLLLQSAYVPNVSLTLCICFCLKRRNAAALVLSALCGFLQETLSGGAMGDCPLLYLLIGWLSIFLSDRFYGQTLKVTLCLVFALSFLYSLLFWGIRCLAWGTDGYGQLLFFNMIPSALYNTALAPLCAWLVRKLFGNGELV